MESQAHINLVNRAMEYVKRIVPEGEHIMIQSDSAGSSSEVRVLGNYVPDVYYCDGGFMIIGEAKTIDDFDRKHSRDQYDAYIDECQLFEGDSCLVIAVPWQLMISAKNYFKRIKQKKNLNIQIIIINELGKEMIV